jgi:hypothetical protein
MRQEMKRAFAFLLALMAFVAIAAPVAATQPDPEHKVDICHRTASDTNPYVLINVDEASLSPGHLDNADPGHKPKFWKSDGTWNGVPHSEGDAKDDYLASAIEIEQGFCGITQTPPEVVTPVAPSVTPPTCEAAGTLVIPEVEGVIYTVEPAYVAGDTGDFTVTATADEGFVLDGEAEFTLTVLPRLTDCGTGGPIDLNCEDFPLAEAVEIEIAEGEFVTLEAGTTAQVALDSFETDLFMLDADGDGVACDTTDEPVTPPAPPAPPVPDTAMSPIGTTTLWIGAVLALLGMGTLGFANLRSRKNRQ